MAIPPMKRVLLKLSGEVLMGAQQGGIDPAFVMDGKTKISDVVAKAGKDAGASIVLKDYVRFQLGEGIEKEASDFAAEVAAASGVPQNKQPEPTA